YAFDLKLAKRSSRITVFGVANDLGLLLTKNSVHLGPESYLWQQMRSFSCGINWKYYINSMMKSLYILMLAAIVLNTGCEKFLDQKSDGSLSIPENEKDIRALLDNDGLMNSAFPGLNDLFSDEYFIDYTVWKSRSELDQRFYVWDGDVSTFQNSS